jgi:hypothetical protein
MASSGRSEFDTSNLLEWVYVKSYYCTIILLLHLFHYSSDNGNVHLVPQLEEFRYQISVKYCSFQYLCSTHVLRMPNLILSFLRLFFSFLYRYLFSIPL